MELETFVKELLEAVDQDPVEFVEGTREMIESETFTEAALYEPLGKEAARTVLSVWQRYCDLMEYLAKNDKVRIHHLEQQLKYQD